MEAEKLSIESGHADNAQCKRPSKTLIGKKGHAHPASLTAVPLSLSPTFPPQPNLDFSLICEKNSSQPVARDSRHRSLI